nr:YwpF-like family protein [Bacillus sp. J37]
MMKTFKLVGLKIDEQSAEAKNIPLLDGLVINKEDGENSWLIEALISKEYLSFFEKHKDENHTLRMFVTISKVSNAPAKISASVNTITVLDESISVLFDGRLLTTRPQYRPEELLESLIDQGLSGNALMDAFKETVQQRGYSTKL